MLRFFGKYVCLEGGEIVKTNQEHKKAWFDTFLAKFLSSKMEPTIGIVLSDSACLTLAQMLCFSPSLRHSNALPRGRL